MGQGRRKELVYTYHWTHAPPGQSNGPFHGSEINYVFGNLAYAATLNNQTLNYTAEDYAIVNKIQSYWVNFMKNGDPNDGNLTYWPPSNNVTKKTMVLGDSFGPAKVGSDEVIELFEDFFAQEPAY